MERHMLVKVISRSRYDDGSECMTFTGKGLLRRTEQGFRLRYAASDESGAKTASDVTVENGAESTTAVTARLSTAFDIAYPELKVIYTADPSGNSELTALESIAPGDSQTAYVQLAGRLPTNLGANPTTLTVGSCTVTIEEATSKGGESP